MRKKQSGFILSKETKGFIWNKEAAGFTSKMEAAGFTSKMEAAGFTIIELLVGISIIAILAGVIISVLNISYQRRRAVNSVDTTKLEQVSQGLEAFNASEDYYPPANSNAPNDPLVSQYITDWPSNFIYIVNGTGTNFDVYFDAGDSTYVKYSSVWGKIDTSCSPLNINVVGTCN